MTVYVRTFDDFAPPRRGDSIPYTEVDVQESASATGPWTTIDTKDIETELGGLDADPDNPQGRDITTPLATLEDGWYRLVWRDASAAISPGSAIRFAPDLLPVTVDELRRYLSQTTRFEQGKASADDAFLAQVLRAAVQQVANYTRRTLTLSEGTITRNVGTEFCGGAVRIPDAREVSEVTVSDQVASFRVVGYPQPDDPAPWVHVYAGRLRFPLPLPWWTGWQGYEVTVAGKFGLDPLPEDLRDAILIIAARKARQRDAAFGDVVALQDGGIVNFFRQFAPEVKAALDYWRVPSEGRIASIKPARDERPDLLPWQVANA